MFDNFDVNSKKAIITGASQGVGAEFAKLLYGKGCSVVIVARTESLLKKVVKETIDIHGTEKGNTISYVAADISKYDQCERVLEEVGFSPDIVFCCAGSSVPGLFLELDEKTLSSGIDINYKTALYFSHVALKAMTKVEKPYKRHLVFFSSVLAFYSFIGYGQYAPMKAALRSLSDILRQEVSIHNIKVECIFPGNTLSEGFLEEEKSKPEITRIIEGPSAPISTEQCCKIIYNALQSGYQYVTTDFIGYVLMSASLGGSPRYYGVIQVIISFLFSIFAPIASMFVNKQIRDYFKKQSRISPSSSSSSPSPEREQKDK
ncbi:hypothetical protein LJB42_002268 [Komagataella kurtzmanii]|nr:hypothetical protein LJB42_002268 [Komagataella kurtzmanii]